MQNSRLRFANGPFGRFIFSGFVVDKKVRNYYIMICVNLQYKTLKIVIDI